MQQRRLGRTGEEVSMIGLGGSHIGQVKDERESIRIIRTAIDNGITFMDNSWDYHGGTSEIRMGKALRDGYRRKVFLMTKIDGRTQQSFNQQLDESLQRLGVDHVDLLQFHEIIRMTDAAWIFGPDGAMEAMYDARRAGKVRYIGFTGHKDPEIHLHMLKTGFDNLLEFDAVQMPLNVMDAHFRSFEKKVLPILRTHNIGVIGMKPMGAGAILKSKVVTPVECLHYALSLPTSVVITGCESMGDLKQAIQAAESFQPLNVEEIALLLARTRALARHGKYEPFKTTERFDSTFQNPQWLGEAA